MRNSAIIKQIPSLNNFADARIMYLQAVNAFHAAPISANAILVRDAAEQNYSRVRDSVIHSFVQLRVHSS